MKQPHTKNPITTNGWYEHEDGTWGYYVWVSGRTSKPELIGSRFPSRPPSGAIAYYPDEERFVLSEREARRVHEGDDSALVWVDDAAHYEADMVLRRSPGRPSLGDKGRTSVLSLKVSEDERRAWETKAAAGEQTLSQWIRERCNR